MLVDTGRTPWQCVEVKRKSQHVVHHVDEVDWQAYFTSIQDVCPWSLASYKRGRIHIVDWRSRTQALVNYDARIYIMWRAKPRLLKKWADRLNDEDEKCEWLFSHPLGGGTNSTPVPCLIQQDRQILTRLRDKNK